MQLKTDTVIKKFIIKVETIYSDNSKRIYVLNTVIEKLNNLNSKNANQKLIIEYIIESLKKKIESYN
jgi:hypothetical protein